MKSININSVDSYINTFPLKTQKHLKQLRLLIKKMAPNAEEVISYQMPAYKLNGILVYFAAYKNHIGFYPMPTAIAAFAQDLSAYKFAKGSIQFPLDKPLPITLITKIVKYRVNENKCKIKEVKVSPNKN